MRAVDPRAPTRALGLFDRILCGVDETPESFEALRQAERLTAPDGVLVAASVLNLAPAAQAGWAAGVAAADIERATREALDRAAEEAPDAELSLLRGSPVPVLLTTLARERATLAVVGSHGHRRALGIALGMVASSVVHDAPCSVLVARRSPLSDKFPSRIVVGVDGSAESVHALAVGKELAERFDADLAVVAACGGKWLDVKAVRLAVSHFRVDRRAPKDALVAASQESDLVVVGSRGLHGVRALGSVSERVAHEAACSVLVVRRTEQP